MRTEDQEDAERYADKCMATYQPVAGSAWFLYCTLDREPWHPTHVAHDAGGAWLMGWANKEGPPNQ